MTILKKTLFVWISVAGALLAGVDPMVSDVRMVPRQNSYTVDIYYKLTQANAYVTLSIETNALAAPEWSGVKIPDCHVTRLVGDVSALIEPDAENEKHIVWNAGEDWPGQSVAEARPRISAWAPENPPLYLVVDVGGAFSTNKLQMMAYTSEAALPYGGLSNDVYRTSLLAMRRISAGSFWMGSPDNELGRYANENWHAVTLLNDFYIGVFEVTQGQWQRVLNTNPATNLNSVGTYDQPQRPVEFISYDKMRGGNWPVSDVTPAGTFVNAMRAKTGLRFDLPTEAQWEYACRAGTQTALYNGRVLTTTAALCTNRFPIAWDAFNSGKVIGVNDQLTRRHHRVGEKQPNAWGLYDMIGNVNENVRDRYQANLGTAPVTEPVGPTTGNDRVRKSGAFDGQRDPRSAYRATTSISVSIGLRLALVPWAAGEWSWTQ